MPPKPKRGCRLPEGWQPDAEGVTCAEGLLGSAWRFELEKFCDYWKARSDRGAIKLDWAATWRNWCRNSAERKPTLNGKSHGTSKPSVADVLERICGEESENPDWVLPQIGRS